MPEAIYVWRDRWLNEVSGSVSNLVEVLEN
jgi:hypothetical protein